VIGVLVGISGWFLDWGIMELESVKNNPFMEQMIAGNIS